MEPLWEREERMWRHAWRRPAAAAPREGGVMEGGGGYIV
jgi:hypothetical protein